MQQQTQTQRALNEQAQEYKRLADGITSTMSDVFEDLLQGTFDLGASIKNWFIRLIADLAAYAAAHAEVLPIITSVLGGLPGQAGAGGVAGTILGALGLGGGVGGSGGLGGGLGDLLGLAGLGQTVAGFFGPAGSITGLFESFAGGLNRLFGTGGFPSGFIGPVPAVQPCRIPPILSDPSQRGLVASSRLGIYSVPSGA